MLVNLDKIQKAKEKLGIKNADIISELFGVEKWDSKNHKGLCPFHHEDTPSFIYNPKAYKARCFGCGKTVDILDAYMASGKTYIEAAQALFEEAEIPYAFGELGVRTKTQYRYPKEEPLNDKKNVYEYLAKRGISEKTIDWADVREDSRGNIVFNYYDTNDVLTLVKYRPSRKIEKGEAKAWCQKDADSTPLLFNMNRVNIEEPLLICEGECDTLAAIEAGYKNAVSVPLGANNYGWIEENFEWLEQFKSIIICADNDDAGTKMQKECVYRLGSWRTKFVEIPRVFEGAADGTKCAMKDLNHVLYYQGKAAVMNLILEAKDTPVDSVRSFGSIKNIDLSEIPGVETGFEALDAKLMRLFYGTLTILTGLSGSGKTSFLSQIVCNVAESGNNVWMYSGELPNTSQKNWIDYIFAGQRNLKAYQTSQGADYWKISPDVLDLISNKYDPNIFFYKDDLSHDADSLMQSLEDCVRKYGVKLAIIDNLLTIGLGSSNSEEKWGKQEEFISRLIAFTTKFNIAIILVVHPKKIDCVRKLSNLDIQGSGSITNLAHRALALHKTTPSEKKGIRNRRGDSWEQEPVNYATILEITKDRMRGTQYENVGFYYDKPSRRFYRTLKDLDKIYSWDTKTYSTPLPYPPEELELEKELFGEVGGER